MSKVSAVLTASTLVLLAGCQDASVPVAPDAMAAVAAKGASPSNTIRYATWDVRATMSDGVTQTAIRSDGSGAYAHGTCGVQAQVFYWSDGGAGDATIDPDANYSAKDKSCSGRRTFLFDLAGGTVSSGAFTNARLLTTLPENGSRSGPMHWDLAVSGCDRLTVSDVVITRIGSAAAWSVETSASSMGQCYKTSKGSLQVSGAPKAMPYSIVITQQ